MQLRLDDDDRWSRVREVLSEDGYTLVFFVANRDVDRVAVTQRLQRWSQERIIPTLKFVRPDRPEQRLLSRFVELSTATTGPFGIVLDETERLIVGDRPLPALQDLNFGRDSLPHIIRGPLVLVVSSFLVSVIRRTMSDFYSTRSLECTIEANDEQPIVPASDWRSLLATAKELTDAHELEGARLAGEQALSAALYTDDVLAEANCREQLGDIERRAGRRERAREMLSSGAALFRRANNTIGEANCLHRLGTVELDDGRLSHARAAFETAVPLYVQSHDLRGLAHCALALGTVLFERDEYDTAQRAIESALTAYRKLGHLDGEANALDALGATFIASDPVRAEALFRSALACYQPGANARGQANSYRHLGEVALRNGDIDVAVHCSNEALARYRRANDHRGEAGALVLLGDIATRQADDSAARQTYGTALEIVRQVQDQRSTADVLLRIARLSTTESGVQAAYRAEAAAIYRSLGLDARAAEASAPAR